MRRDRWSKWIYNNKSLGDTEAEGSEEKSWVIGAGAERKEGWRYG